MKKLKLWIKKKSKLNLGQKKYYKKIVDDAMKKKKGYANFCNFFFVNTHFIFSIRKFITRGPFSYFQSVIHLLTKSFHIHF